MSERPAQPAPFAAPDFLSVGSQTAARSDAEFLRSILASSGDCIKVLDLDARLIFMTEGGQHIMEVSDFNTIRGCPWPDFWSGPGNAAAKQAVATAKAGGIGHFQGPATTLAGTLKYWDVMVTPIRGPDGRPERLLSVSRDITVGWQAEQRRAELTQELAHRMKNMLAMVQAIASQTFRQARTVREGRDAFASRLAAMAQAQDILTRTDWTGASIRAVVDGALAPHRTGENRISAQGPDVELTAQQGLGLSLALHELATNALKYGALSDDRGRVAILWENGTGREFVFEWRETDGPKVEQPSHEGFGTRLIQRIVAPYFDGEGQLAFAPGGVTFRLVGSLGPAD